ncbi:MAG: nucleotidyl transferase AbiEii/AbiGii toxin family protein [Verrucomicrobiales bacterium]|nr:nucleotidyl transferase AbiEii/AbiGii toxin family protein [Verrucomicrobiales bacterium]
MKSAPKNIAASVRQRLAQLAARRGYDFQQVLTSYAIERLLFRLSVSSHARDFILKGATLFTLWEGFPHRQTRDLDLLGFGTNNIERLVIVFREICAAPVTPDGLSYSDIAGEPIRGIQEYGGIRLRLSARLEKAMVPFGVDIGFGDEVTPPPTEMDFPTLLDFPKPNLRVYPVETVVAEKVEAMVRLGMANSRMKDFFDLWHLSRTTAFDGEKLCAALRATFTRRSSVLPCGLPLGLTQEFAMNPAKQTQWRAFCRKDTRLKTDLPLSNVVLVLAAFLGRPIGAAAEGRPFRAGWRPEGSWSPAS